MGGESHFRVFVVDSLFSDFLVICIASFSILFDLLSSFLSFNVLLSS